jgi:cytochrome P450
MKLKCQQCVNLWASEFDKQKKKTSESVQWVKINTVGTDLQRLTLDILGQCVYGQNFDSLGGNISGVIQAYNNCMDHIFEPVRLVLPNYDYLPIASNRKLAVNTKEFDLYCWKIIEQGLKDWEDKNNNPEREAESEERITEKGSLITMMIKHGLTGHEMRDHVGMFFLAGHETTAATLIWIVSWLSMNLEIQEKARRQVLEKVPGEITFEALKDLFYLDWIIKETTRYSSVITVLNGRIADSDITLGDWKIPKGTQIFIDFYSMMHKKSIWGDPEIFRPERWDPANLTEEQKYSWIPFSGGPRVCIGMNFSIQEQKIFLVTLFKTFPLFRLSPGSELKPSIEKFTNYPNIHNLAFDFSI